MIINVEVFGYISMVVCLISILMKDIKKLRIINTIACIMFVIYGIMIAAYPVIVMNICCIAINLYHLYDLKTTSTNDKSIDRYGYLDPKH